MPLFSFLNKLRSRRSNDRLSPFIPDRILHFDPIATYVNEAVDITQTSIDKIRASSPLSRECEGRNEFPRMPRIPSGRLFLSSTMKRNVSSFARKSTRRSGKKGGTSSPLHLHPRSLPLAASSSNVDTDLSLLSSLLNDYPSDNYSTITLHGTVTAKVLIALLENIGKQKKIVFDEAILHVNPSEFSSLVFSLGVESLSFLGCSFDDAQLISDRFFLENSQIKEITVSAKDGSIQSFPLLTDRTLSRWSSLPSPPSLQLHNISTSFTITGVENLVKSFLSTATPFDRLCCKLGRLNTPMDTVLHRLSRIRSLKVQSFNDSSSNGSSQIHSVHHSFLVVLSHNPRLELTLQTASPLPSNDTTLDFPSFPRFPPFRRRFTPVGSSSPQIPPFHSTSIPESEMISKRGVQCSSTRTRRKTRQN
ncbi:hypothetical protein PMAYCL1PPCAC_29752, partial [Pristionchus mayeri]